MGFIFGIISKKGNQIDEELLQKCIKASGQSFPDGAVTWLENNAAFAYHQVIISPEANRKSLFIHESGCVVTADCRIDYREELARKLEISSKNLDHIPDGHLILQSYSKWGESCVEHLIGDFAFAIWDKKRQKLFCARDQLGCRPFYYFENTQVFLFSTNMKGFGPVHGVEFIPKKNYILHHFSSKALPIDQTLYEGISRLPPAHFLVVSSEFGLVTKRYWDLEINPMYASLSIDEALERFRSIFKDAVSQRIRNHPAVGIELSGGLDSSSVAVVAQEVKQEGTKIHAFINALSGEQKREFFPFCDETEYGRSVADHAGLDSFHLINGENGKASLESVMDAIETTQSPVVQLFPAFSDQLLNKVQELDLNRLLSGFGGDECVSYNARGILNEYASNRDWKKVNRAIEGRPPLKRLTILVKLFLEHRVVNYSGFFKKLVRNRKTRYKISDLAMDSSFLRSFRTIEREWKDSRDVVDYRIREQQRLRLMHESVSDRLENSYLLAQKRQIEYAYPLLDIKLLVFVYSLPVEFKYNNGLGRYLLRRAMEGLLPENVRMRTSKSGAAVPNIFYRFHLDRDQYLKLIDEAERCNNFHYLDYKKLRWQIGKLMDQKNFVQLSFGPRIFFSSISLLILQKWKREGKMNTGIKC